MQWMILPFRRYADFEGRSRRMEFWMFQLLNIVLISVLAVAFLVRFLGGILLSFGNSGAGGEMLQEA